MTEARKRLAATRRWVVKIGSSLVTDHGQGLDLSAMQAWAAQVAALRADGVDVVLVSSGAVAEGMQRLGWSRRPHQLYALQAAAAVGQMGLVQAWESCFQQHRLHTAQVLLTHDDLSNRRRYLNARSTLQQLLTLGVVPVVNENDTVVTDEICFGDNDSLAALVANLIEADLLLILTDQAGMYRQDPRSNPDAELLHEELAEDPALQAMAGGGGRLGRGGMMTKLRAAQLAARSGTSTLIAAGGEPDVLARLRQGERLGTLLLPSQAPVAARKQWLAAHLQVRGTLRIDTGAEKVLVSGGKSLLAVGVREVGGNFVRGELVSCLSEDGRELARGLINYSADETRRIMGKSSELIESILGYVDEEELIHRDNLVLL